MRTSESTINAFNVTPEIDTLLRMIVTERKYRQREVISGIGDLRNHVFYIISGSARVYFISQGKEHTYSFAFENEFITLSSPLLSDSDYVPTIEFLEPSRVAILPLDRIQAILRKEDPNVTGILIKNIMISMIHQMTALEERLLMMQTCSAKERYEWLLNRYPKIFERAKQTQIASFLGVTKETLYRIRGGKY